MRAASSSAMSVPPQSSPMGSPRMMAASVRFGVRMVGAARQLRHSVAQLGRVGGVHLAMVGHHRVHHAQRVRVHPVQVADAVHLFRRAQEARIHGIDLHADVLPCGQIVGQHLGGVVHVPAGERRVGGEQAGRNRAHVAGRRPRAPGWPRRASTCRSRTGRGRRRCAECRRLRVGTGTRGLGSWLSVLLRVVAQRSAPRTLLVDDRPSCSSAAIRSAFDNRRRQQGAGGAKAAGRGRRAASPCLRPRRRRRTTSRLRRARGRRTALRVRRSMMTQASTLITRPRPTRHPRPAKVLKRKSYSAPKSMFAPQSLLNERNARSRIPQGTSMRVEYTMSGQFRHIRNDNP